MSFPRHLPKTCESWFAGDSGGSVEYSVAGPPFAGKPSDIREVT